MSLLRISLASAFAATSVGAFAQADQGTLAKIAMEGKENSYVMTILWQIAYGIGPRLTGSPELAKGQKWAMEQFKSWGLKNVHLEKWGEVPVGSSRGPLQVVRLIGEKPIDMVFTSPSWSNGTNGLERGEAVLAPTTMEEFNKVKNTLKGKWLVYKTGRGGGAANELSKALDESGILGRIYGSSNELVITSGTWTMTDASGKRVNKTYDNHPGLPQVQVRKSDMAEIIARFDAGKKVTMEIGMDNLWQKGPVPQYDVVAEIPGIEKPDEVVIVSGHFDSWNGPGSQGALDNGTGSSTAMEAARILATVGAKPKRTIRFILWSGEEQGLYGSQWYVKAHAKELDKISAVLVDDGGTNYQGGYVGIESQKEMLTEAIQMSIRAFPDMPQTITTTSNGKMPRGGGSDHAPFNAAYTPGFFTKEVGRSDYNFVHHTQHDRYDKAIPEYLVQSATNHALVSFYLACAPTLLPREPKPAPEKTDPAKKG